MQFSKKPIQNAATTNVRHTTKGQYFSFDALMSALILVLAVSLLSAYWFGVQNNSLQQESRMLSRALSISDSLLTSGSPPDWEDADSVRSFGLAYELNSSLSEEKINELTSYLSNDANYALFSSQLSVPNVFVNITSLDNSFNYHFGRPPAENARQSIVTRVAQMHGTMASMRISVWSSATATQPS